MFESMRLTRLQFKYDLRYVKQHDNIMRKDSLAKKLAMSDPTKFWSEIRMMSGHNNTLPSCVEGVSGKGRIVEQWRLHFEIYVFIRQFFFYKRGCRPIQF